MRKTEKSQIRKNVATRDSAGSIQEPGESPLPVGLNPRGRPASEGDYSAAWWRGLAVAFASEREPTDLDSVWAQSRHPEVLQRWHFFVRILSTRRNFLDHQKGQIL